VVESLYDIVSDKVVGVNLLMARLVVTFPMVIHFTQPLQAFLAGLSPRPAGRVSAASKVGCFWTHASLSTPPARSARLGDHLCLTECGTPARGILSEWHLGYGHLEAPVREAAHRVKA
jgi:hypothetical protein